MRIPFNKDARMYRSRALPAEHAKAPSTTPSRVAQRSSCRCFDWQKFPLQLTVEKLTATASMSRATVGAVGADGRDQREDGDELEHAFTWKEQQQECENLHTNVEENLC